MRRIIKKMINVVHNYVRRKRMKKNKKIVLQSSNQNRSILCNMCLGGVLSHDLGLRFDSPLVNLMIPGNEFVDLLQSKGLYGKLTEKSLDKSYPVGMLDGKYSVHFIHYKTFNDARSAWERRLARVDMDNAYVILVETSSCTYEDLERFDALPFEHKMALVHKEYPSIKCAKLIHGFDGKNRNGEILGWTTLGRRMYDQVDWLSFLNFKK